MRAHEFLYEDVENFPIANVRRANGAIGNQGVNIEQAADVLTHAAGMQVSPDMSMRQLVDALKADPAAQQRLRQFVQKNPITVSALPDGSYHLQDGHHRTFLLNLLGDETVPAVVKEGMAEGKQPGKPIIDAILNAMPIAQEIWFHGSRAIGKHRKNSDTDILVVVPDDLVGDQYLGVVRILQKLSTHFDNHDIQPTKAGTNIHRIAQEEGRLLWSNKQGVAEGSEHEGLVLQFLKSITPKELRYYSIRDNCGPAALHMMDWAKEKGIELHRVNGYFVADNVVYDKADFTKEMKHEFLQQGLDFNDPNSRQEFIASNPKYSKEWKKVPHYWLQDDQGTVYDPTGYIQFIKTGLAKDLDKSRYETKQGVAEGLVYEADASAVRFQTASTDNYQSSFTVTAIADGKNVGHFSFFRDPETDDVHNQAEVTDDVRGKGYGKALLLKAIEVANDHGLGFQEDSQSLSRAQSRVYDSLYDAGWIVDADGYWFLTPEGEQELARLSTIQQGVTENFADGKNPQDKGDSARHGIPKKASLTQLDKIGHGSGRKAQLARWQANMRRGRAK